MEINILEFFGQDLAKILSIGGLSLDLVGVLLLGLDLIKVQRKISAEAEEAEGTLESFLADYGDLPEALSDLQKNTRRIQLHEYSDYHAEDETSYNIDVQVERMKELAGIVKETTRWTSLLVEFQREQTQNERGMVASSVKFSVIGLLLIVIGFGMQIVAQFI